MIHPKQSIAVKTCMLSQTTLCKHSHDQNYERLLFLIETLTGEI